MTDRQRERRAALMLLMHIEPPPGLPVERMGHGPFLRSLRSRWSRGDVLKRELLIAWAAHNQTRHAGELFCVGASALREWRRA